jgi:CHAT domain-containing protein/Tfp pilus assembly protein PilF
MTDRSRPDSDLNGPSREFTSQSLAKFLCLFFSTLAIALSENTLGYTVGRPGQQPSQAPRDGDSKADDEKEARLLEPRRPIKRELAGDQSHTYQIRLSAGQYLKVIVEQQGIDVVVQVSGPDGRQILEFDSESRSQGREEVSLVAEAEGDFRLIVHPRLKGAPAGSYAIRVEEVRLATDADRALHYARKQFEEALKLNGAGKHDEALPLVERAIEIRERFLGAENSEVAAAIDSLADIYAHRGEYVKAEPLYRRALDIREKALGKDHPSTADSLNTMAVLYYRQGKYEEAEPLVKRELSIREKALGQDHPSTAQSLNNLAALYASQGKYEEAEPLYKRSLSIREKALGKDHPNTASNLNNLAELYFSQGKYVEAEPLHKRSLAIREKALGKDHPLISLTLNNLAVLFASQGKYGEAGPLFKRALAIDEKALGKDHPNTAYSLNNLAGLYASQGKYGEAEPLFKRALAIREKVLGKDHPDTAASLHNLAGLNVSLGRYGEAEPLYKRALDIREKALGKDHPSTAQSLNYLAFLYYKLGKYGEAEPLYKRALAIREKALGNDHLDTADSLDDLAALYTAKGDLAQAVTVQSRANSVSERNLALNLGAGSERQKLAYLALFSEQTDFTLSLHSQAVPHDPRALDLAFTTLLRRKGRGLDVMANTIAALRRRAAPEDQALFDQLTEARSQLAVLTLKGAGTDNPQAYRARLKLLADIVEELESTLSARSPEFRAQVQPVTPAAVQAALPADSALIEFAVFTPRDLRNNRKKLPPRYLAYLLAARGEPRLIDLGEAVPIDRAITAWRRALRNPRRSGVKRLARAVDEKVMRPVLGLAQSGSGETRRLLIAPDGLLNLVPFAALVDRQGRYLIERYSISYLTSGRDLLRSALDRPVEQRAVIVADPAYGQLARAVASSGRDVGLPPGLPQSSGAQLNLSQVYFPPLIGTADEAQALRAILPQATVLTGEQATETALKGLHSPRILHVATHGFFLRDQELELIGGRDMGAVTVRSVIFADQPVENPLLRSGLALAGVNRRLGRTDQGDDGVLTALEAAGLDLWGTKLVVLSACDTGVGEVKNGEGVFGLRRALALAGAETQLMSLWPVSDVGTRELMIEYYKGLQRGEGRGDGLRRVQLEMLKGKYRRHPFYWASFIQAGEWANLEGKR